MEQEILIRNADDLKNRIYVIRGVQVMLDSDLAAIYGYSTKAFNQQIKNNIERFDEDLRFQLTEREMRELSRCKNCTLNNNDADTFLRWKNCTSKRENDDSSRSKILTLNEGKTERGHNIKYAPYVFTEQGIYMLMTVLKGDLAVAQSKMLIRLFKQMKDYIVENQQIVKQRDFLRLSLQTADNAQKLVTLRQNLTAIDDKVEEVVSNLGDMVRKSDLSPIMLNLGKPEIPAGWLILNGQPVESDLAYQQIYSLADKTIFIIDNYISLKTLILFRHVKQNVAVTIFSDNAGNGLHEIELQDFRKEFPGLHIELNKTGGVFHDRYIVLDYGTPGEKVYHCGASSKDGGRKITTITLIEDVAMYRGVIDGILGRS